MKNRLPEGCSKNATQYCKGKTAAGSQATCKPKQSRWGTFSPRGNMRVSQNIPGWRNYLPRPCSIGQRVKKLRLLREVLTSFLEENTCIFPAVVSAPAPAPAEADCCAFCVWISNCPRIRVLPEWLPTVSFKVCYNFLCSVETRLWLKKKIFKCNDLFFLSHYGSIYLINPKTPWFFSWTQSLGTQFSVTYANDSTSHSCQAAQFWKAELQPRTLG